ncbi:MAG: hypothetical protein LC778_20740 [Acidobacteria bacterium]|nr:hypothetical protein [Acidobacteriota bacterium]
MINENMFCPNCGKADQQKNTYCRSCGEHLPDLSKKSMAFGGNTPEEQIKMTLFFNLASAIVSFAMAILLYATHWAKEDKSFSVYLAAAFFLVIGGWQISNFVVGLKLKKHFDRRKNTQATKEDLPSSENLFQMPKRNDLLNEADYRDIVPNSITENTTKQLSKKIKEKSS